MKKPRNKKRRARCTRLRNSLKHTQAKLSLSETRIDVLEYGTEVRQRALERESKSKYQYMRALADSMQEHRLTLERELEKEEVIADLKRDSKRDTAVVVSLAAVMFLIIIVQYVL